MTTTDIANLESIFGIRRTQEIVDNRNDYDETEEEWVLNCIHGR